MQENLLNKLHQCKFRAGDKVFAKILPARKGIYEAKYEGPYIIESVKGSSLVLKNLGNKKIITRNEHRVKRYNGEWRHERQVYIHESLRCSNQSTTDCKCIDTRDQLGSGSWLERTKMSLSLNSIVGL